MTERDESLYVDRRVEVCVVPEKLSDEFINVLVNALGAFAIEQELGMRIEEDQRDGNWSVVLEEGLQSYNPELVEWVTGKKNSPPVPVIPLGKLRIFAFQIGIQEAEAARKITAVSRNLEGGEEYLHGHHKYPVDETAGFRADLFSDLVRRLGKEEVRNIGEIGLSFLQQVNENLWVPAENQQGST